MGDDYIVGIRMVVDEQLQEQGLQREEGIIIAQTLIKEVGIDFVNVIRGHIETDEGLSHVIPNMGTPSAPHLEFAGAVKAELGVPVFHAARINDVATARHAIREGYLDMVGMTRAHMADPYIVAKIERGEEERIRPCVGAGYCIDRIYEGEEALCTHSPATGREEILPHVIPKTEGAVRKVVVVGAGPAGLEAARVCAERGHQVVLFEAADRPGGQVALAAKVPRRQEIIGVTDWLYDEVSRLGVTLNFNHYAEAEEVLAEAPDVVIIATGGIPNTGFLQAGEELVTTTWDILSGFVPPGDAVMLFDDNGQHPGVSCAEYMAGLGCRLELITPDRMIAADLGGTNLPAYLKAFYETGVQMTLNHRLTAVRREGDKLVASLFNEYTKDKVERRVDQIVVEHGTLPVDELYFELRPDSVNDGEIDLEALLAGRPQALSGNPDGRYQLFRIGDAVTSRNIHAAIYDALRLCKDL